MTADAVYEEAFELVEKPNSDMSWLLNGEAIRYHGYYNFIFSNILIIIQNLTL